MIGQHYTKSHKPDVSAYADDSKLALCFSSRSDLDQERAVIDMERCIDDVRAWMVSRKLKINDDKTEADKCCQNVMLRVFKLEHTQPKL